MLPVRTGIVGLGYWGPNVLRNFAAQEGCAMTYACDMDETKLQNIRKQYPTIACTKRYEDLLEDASVELILIATPTSSHYPLAKAALEAGKHVFIEKPITSSVTEAQELTDLATQKGRCLFVDHTFVFAPAVTKLAELAQSNALGKLLYFDSSRLNLGLIQKDANVLLDLAIHDLSILNTIVDLETVTEIAAYGGAHFGTQEEDAHLHLTFSSGFQAHIHVSWLSPVKIRQTILAGTKSMALYDDTHPSEKIRIYDRGVDHDDTKPDPFFPKYRSGDIVIPSLPNLEPLSLEARHVLRCVRGEEQPVVSGKVGTKILTIVQLATEALRSKTILSLTEGSNIRSVRRVSVAEQSVAQ